MRLINLTFLLLVGHFSLYGQQEIDTSTIVNITKSEPYSVVDAHSKMYFRIDNNTLQAIKIVGKEQNQFIFQVFSGDNMNLKSSVSELIEDEGFNFEYIHFIKNRLFFFYTIADKKKKNTQLFVREINKERGGFYSEAKSLLSVSNILYSQGGRFQVDISNNEGNFVIKYKCKSDSEVDSKNQNLVGLAVFSNELEKLWAKEYLLPYSHEMMEELSFSTSSDEDAFLLVKKYGTERTRKNKEDPENESIMILVANGSNDLREIEFRLGDKLVVSAQLEENKDGDLICAGYYRKSKILGVDGVFVSVIVGGVKFDDPKFYEFSLDFIKQYQRLKEKDKFKLEKSNENGSLSFSDLVMRGIEVLPDGGIIIAGDIYYITSTTDSKGNTKSYFHHDDVVLTKLNSDGSLGWMRKIFRRSSGPYGSPFGIYSSEKYTYVVFNDSKQNATITDDGSFDKDVKGSYVTAHRMENITGSLKYLYLFNPANIEGLPVYQYSQNRLTVLNDYTYAVELYIKDKQDIMFKMEFTE